MTPLWRVDFDDLLRWIDGSGWRRARFDRWLLEQGLPPGSELAAGSVCVMRDLFGRRWVYARRLADGRWVRARATLPPPAGLHIDRPDLERSPRH